MVAEADGLQGALGVFIQPVFDRVEEDFGAELLGEAEDAAADGGQADACQLVLLGQV